MVALKYYIYISDTKVDMLYSQISKPLLRSIASDLSIDLKLLGAEVSVANKSNPSDETRYAKVKIVSDYIEKHLDVGSVDAPSTYFKGTLQMQWGQLVTDANVVYFGGLTERTVLGLGGSIHHIIGRNQGTPFSTPSMSPLLFLWEALAITHNDTYKNMADDAIDARSFSHPIDLVAHLSLNMNGPFQQFEFLAKTLIQSPWLNDYNRLAAQSYIVLGSPIYVALAD